jgi:hypothetical protein
VDVKADGSSKTTPEQVKATMSSALRAAVALSVRTVFVPLIGAGTEAVPAGSSFAAIFGAFKAFIQVVPDYPFALAIVIRQEAELSRNEAGQILRENPKTYQNSR